MLWVQIFLYTDKKLNFTKEYALEIWITLESISGLEPLLDIISHTKL
jgi:hypothetical protein